MAGHAEIIPLPAVHWGGGDIRDVTLLKVTTPDGMTGLGSAYTGVNQVRDALMLHQQKPGALHAADADMTIAMSAIDIARWDIRGKEEGLSVSELLGGRQRDRVLAYATVDLPMTAGRTGDAFEQILRSFVDQGFKAIKLCIEDFGRRDNSLSDKEWDRHEARQLASARKVVGNDIQLMLDVYGSDSEWNVGMDWALRTAEVLAALDYLWFEEPLAPMAYDDFVQLTERTNIAIAGGEDFVLLEDFEILAKCKAVDILQPDCTRVGGLTRMQAIRNVASQNGLHVIPHGWNTAVGLAADIHFQATVTGDEYCMVEVWPDKSITELLKDNPFALDKEGKIAVPDAPGLGIALREEYECHNEILEKDSR